jgi:glycosyltransferase involved in cell wall biosynthesis
MDHDQADSIAVSICCITYNHEKYIAQAIDGFLMQNSTFAYEIIIGEDRSTDDTGRLVREYADRYPNLIKRVTSERNVGARLNGIRTRAAAQGKYIALCEGDDYWTDPLKLQKQVDFLESHPGCAMCCHNVTVIYDDSREPHPAYVEHPDQPYKLFRPQPQSSFQDLLRYNFIHTASVMFRSSSLTEVPVWFYDLDRGDWPLFVLLAERGNIGYLDEVMATHRVHAAGVYSSMSRVEQLKGATRVAGVINRHFEYRFEQQIWDSNAANVVYIFGLLREQGRLSDALTYTVRQLLDYGRDIPRSKAAWYILRAFRNNYMPRILRRLRR